MVYSSEEKVKWLAITSRAAILCLQLLLNIIVPDHDARVFKKPLDLNHSNTFLDSFVNYIFDGLLSWDAQYFLHIAEYGYTYENTLAFFPLFPLLIKHLSYMLFYTINYVIGYFLPFGIIISFHSCLLITGAIFNNVIFVKTATTLFRLSNIVLKNEKLSYISGVLFCFNPASIFFSAFYSESLYCFLVFYGLLEIEKNNFLLSGILIGLSGLARSNGIINIGFIGYNYLKLKINKKLTCANHFIFLICVIVSALPFFSYQLYGYLKYCTPANASLPKFIQTHAVQNEYKLPGSSSPWCRDYIPLPYSYVQSHYWNVGFLRYYHLKQIPNFLLALPAFVIVLRGVITYVRHHKFSLLYLGLKTERETSPFPKSTFSYVLHCLALSVFSALVIHIQVATRLLFSSSPVPYWFSAWFVTGGVRETAGSCLARKFAKKGSEGFVESYENRNSKWKTFLLTEKLNGSARFIKYYYMLYFFVGTFMFSNHLPWT